LGNSIEICVPDIGDFEEVDVVEILVAKGDRIEFDDPLVSIESDKATMEIPSTAAGVVAELRVSEGDRVSEGSVLILLELSDDSATASESGPDARSQTESDAEPSAAEPSTSEPEAISVSNQTTTPAAPASVELEVGARSMSVASANPVPDRVGLPHASPLVRQYARELGLPLESAQGSGPHGRVLIDDLKRRVRDHFSQQGGAASGASTTGIPTIPPVDFAAFGPVREAKLTRIQKLAGPSLHRSWLNVPHVTQYDEADITDLERFRKQRREAASERGLKLSPLLFVMKAVVVALQEFPTLRASLAPEADRLFIKDYFHLGIAVDTDQGLVVPVIRDVDRKGIFELAAELSETAQRARNRKLKPDDLQGAVFTLSSLGGIGGTAFSPIVNAPEVAILGLSKTRVQPVWRGPSPIEPVASSDSETPQGRFEPRLVLPLSLSYDHRVIDGAEAVRFTTRLARILEDPMLLLL
jgi:pyruvate dehydrogenase E2 component (dihydrolipoamide acetyltransferase)